MAETKALLRSNGNFPVLSGNIIEDTDAVISELNVGDVVVERGMARLYLIWLTRSFLDIHDEIYRCQACSFDGVKEDAACPRCGGILVMETMPRFPTLEEYLSFISDETGKSRQTLFSRLRVYRSLSGERSVNPTSVFLLNLLSSGAARKLAAASEDNPMLTLENDSWQDTVDMALSLDSRSMALEYIKYDVLHEPKISAERSGDNKFTVYHEQDHGGEEIVVDSYDVKLEGRWTEEMIEWFGKKLGARMQE